MLFFVLGRHRFYDSLSRLLEADYDSGTTIYQYGYDLAGNLVNNNGTTRTYNAANQMTYDGTNTLTYDANGNLTNDGVNAYTWDRANRMLTAPNSTSYVYDGASNRIQQTVSSVVTDYLNDVQPGLVKLLRQDDGSNIDHFVHAPRGIHAVDDGTDWTWFAQDGLGSVRGLVDDAAVVQQTHEYDPYGNYIGTAPTDMYFGFTGQYTDKNEQLYLRARYYSPEMGVFSALDPFEGVWNRPMSLNGYNWVEGNVPNMVDPSGNVVTKGGIESGIYEYSCRCGWLDWSHISLGDPMFNLLGAMDTAFNHVIELEIERGYSNELEFWYGFRILGKVGKVVGGHLIELTLFDDIALFNPQEIFQLGGANVSVAVSILKEKDERFEAAQGNWFWGNVPDLGASSFSEEDLPSNLIGMYIGKERYFNNTSPSTLKANITEWCRGFGVAGSIAIFEQVYSSGEQLTEWHNWFPRLVPLPDCLGDLVLDQLLEGCGREQNQEGWSPQYNRYPSFLQELASYIHSTQRSWRWHSEEPIQLPYGNSGQLDEGLWFYRINRP